MTHKRLTIGLIVLVVLVLGIVPALAQDGGDTAAPDEGGRVVTADEVNQVAKELYCPVCEGIPLDTCGTAACEDWRLEIRGYLEDGWTEEQIVDDFIVRFGDRVVGVPDDPTLQTVSLGTPLLMIVVSLLAVSFVILRLRLNGDRSQAPQPAAAQASASTGDSRADSYRAMLEQDVTG